MTKKKFDYEEIDTGFYDHIYQKKEGVRSAWHHIKINFVREKIDNQNHHLDIGIPFNELGKKPLSSIQLCSILDNLRS